MSSVLTNEYAESFWKHCPSDILMLIFKRLDVKSLVNCMRVTKSWLDTVHYYCQHYNLWGEMLEVIFNKNVRTYEEKSDLNDQDLFLSASHWLNIQDPTILLHNECRVEKTRNISVLKDLDYVETSSLVPEFTLPNSEVIDIRSVLWVYIANERKWACKALARYYGNKRSLTTIHCPRRGDLHITQNGRHFKSRFGV